MPLIMKNYFYLLGLMLTFALVGCSSGGTDDTRPTPKEPANVTEAPPGAPVPGEAAKKGEGN
jgi:hypothetical protein